jgi:hypothetical protein
VKIDDGVHHYHIVSNPLALQVVSSKSALYPTLYSHTLSTVTTPISTVLTHCRLSSPLGSPFLPTSSSPPLSSSVLYWDPHIPFGHVPLPLPLTTTIKHSRKFFPNNDRSITRCHVFVLANTIPKYRNPCLHVEP